MSKIYEGINIDFSELEFIKIKNDFKNKLDKYKNLIYEKWKEIDSIDEIEIINSFQSKFDEEVILLFNLPAFIKKINQILILKDKKGLESIKKEFNEYYESLDHRYETLKNTKGIDHFDEWEGEGSMLPRKLYEKEKYLLQIELLKLQKWVIENKKRICIVFEGRDAAGKGSTIKRFIEYLNPKHFKVVALGVPSEQEKINWFQRYEKYLPEEGEIVFFDRSWYNRAVVEPAMGYCTEEQYMDFMNNVNTWEKKLIENDVILIKFWFSITKEKQSQRFEFRKKSPLKYWKFSPNDEKVISKWDIITFYKNQMFSKTSTLKSPWVIINSNDKKIGRLNAIRYFLSQIDYDDKIEELTEYYPEVVSVLY